MSNTNQSLPERLADHMAEDDVLGSMRFVTLTDDDRANMVAAAVTMINARHAPRPVSAEDIHIHSADMSTSALDSYFSHMHPSSLRNFAADAKDGRAFMNMHRTGGYGRVGELPLGHTFTGQYTDAGDAQAASAGIYMLRGSSLTGTSTDEVSRAIDAGTVRDVSVGFSGGKSICDVCGNDLRDWEKCPHVPGSDYGCPKGTVCTYSVQDARLREVSAVYEGATPGAMFSRSCLDKTERSIAEGVIGVREIVTLEEHYRMPLTDSRKFISLPGKAPATQTERNTDDMKTKPFVDHLIVRCGAHLPEDARKALEDVRAKAGDDDADLTAALSPIERVIEAAHTATETLAAFRAAGVTTVDEARKLKADGEDGRTYRADLIKETLAEGVRAQGEHFNREVYEKILGEPSRSTADIKSMRDAFHKQAQERLSSVTEDGKPSGQGGRQTTPIHGFEDIAGGADRKPAGSARNYQTRR